MASFGDTRKPAAEFLDLSRSTWYSEAEVKAALAKLPEMRLRPDIVSGSATGAGERYCPACDGDASDGRDFPFMDPYPEPMRQITLRELSYVDIDWKMLTLLRPRTEQEIIFYDKLVQLDRLTFRSKIQNGCREMDSTEKEREEFTYDFFGIRRNVDESKHDEEDAPVAEETTQAGPDDQTEENAERPESPSENTLKSGNKKSFRKKRRKRLLRKKKKKRRKKKRKSGHASSKTTETLGRKKLRRRKRPMVRKSRTQTKKRKPKKAVKSGKKKPGGEAVRRIKGPASRRRPVVRSRVFRKPKIRPVHEMTANRD